REGRANVIAYDDKAESREAARALGAEIVEPQRWSWSGIAALVLSPGVPLTHPTPHPVVRRANEAGVSIIGDIELFALSIGHLATDRHGARIRPPIAAITGTNGKSTTTALLGHILNRTGFNAQVGGNIGKPVLELDPPAENSAYVLELSSYQIDLTRSLRPATACLLNLTPDHLDRHGTMENYARVKARLLQWVPKTGAAVIGIDDQYTEAIFTELWAKRARDVIPVSVGRALGYGVYVLQGVLYDGTRSPAIEIEDLKTLETLKGAHNWQNAAVAFAMAASLGRDKHAIARAMHSFPGLAHRLELAGEIGGVKLVNDSKATNADAASKALWVYDPVYWIAGGVAKEGGIESLKPFFPRIAEAYLIGSAAPAFARTLEASGVKYTMCGDLETATRRALADARTAGKPGATVLLSPACASFDQFKDFEERGDKFKAIVRALAKEAGAPAGKLVEESVR
ncbi:MAG: UDP-N-acetylmuramoyl-L-alanine--D-glutamate ligase, partial [Alphaproteobacteria bacterium]